MSGIVKLIEHENERKEALQEIEKLWDSQPGSPEADRLKLLAKLVEIYEKECFPIAPCDPVTAIRFRMEQTGLTRKSLEAILGGRNRVSEILNGRRSLSKAMIIALHSNLGIPLESLLEIKPARPASRAARRVGASKGRRAARSRRTLR